MSIKKLREIGSINMDGVTDFKQQVDLINWIEFTYQNKYEISAKVYSQPSDYGVSGKTGKHNFDEITSRVSKLSIKKDGREIYGYDRGFDHGNDEGIQVAKDIVNKVVTNELSLKDEDMQESKKLFKAVYDENPNSFNEEFNKLLKEKVMSKINAKKEDILNELSAAQLQQKRESIDALKKCVKDDDDEYLRFKEEGEDGLEGYIEKNYDRLNKKYGKKCDESKSSRIESSIKHFRGRDDFKKIQKEIKRILEDDQEQGVKITKKLVKDTVTSFCKFNNCDLFKLYSGALVDELYDLMNDEEMNEKVVTTEHGYKFDNKEKSEKVNTEHGKIVTDTTEPEVDDLVDTNLGDEYKTGVYMNTMKRLRDMNALEQQMAYLLMQRTGKFKGTCAEFNDQFADNYFNQKTGILVK